MSTPPAWSAAVPKHLGQRHPPRADEVPAAGEHRAGREHRQPGVGRSGARRAGQHVHVEEVRAEVHAHVVADIAHFRVLARPRVGVGGVEAERRVEPLRDAEFVGEAMRLGGGAERELTVVDGDGDLCAEFFAGAVPLVLVPARRVLRRDVADVDEPFRADGAMADVGGSAASARLRPSASSIATVVPGDLAQTRTMPSGLAEWGSSAPLRISARTKPSLPAAAARARPGPANEAGLALEVGDRGGRQVRGHLLL